MPVTHSTHLSARARGRRGFTLVELLTTMVLFGIVMGALMNVVVRQQRFYRGTSEVIDMRTQLRQAAAILPSELRGVSPAGGDLIAIANNAIEFWTTIGSGVTCGVNDGAGQIILAPREPANGGTLTAWSSEPKVGDVAHVLFIGPTAAAYSIVPFTLTEATTTSTTACAGSPFLTAADDGKDRYLVKISSIALSATGLPFGGGMPVRFVRRVRYSLYQSSGSWYLGYQEGIAGGGYATVQPVSGPYMPDAADATSGLRFTYFDMNGAATTNPTQVARIDVAVRAPTTGSVANTGYTANASGQHVETDNFSVALRNRW